MDLSSQDFRRFCVLFSSAVATTQSYYRKNSVQHIPHKRPLFLGVWCSEHLINKRVMILAAGEVGLVRLDILKR